MSERTLRVVEDEIERLKQRMADRVVENQPKITDLRMKVSEINKEISKLYYNDPEDAKKLQDLSNERKDLVRKTHKWYKWVPVTGKSKKNTEFEYNLPRGTEPGRWHEVDGPIILCKNGLHATQSPKLWTSMGKRLFEVEVGGEVKHSYNKSAFSRLRFVREIEINSAEYCEVMLLRPVV